MAYVDTSSFKVAPGTTVDLSEFDTRSKGDFAGKKRDGKDAHDELNTRLEELQELMYAEGKHRLLVVLQATDTGGKDSTIRHVFDGVNPQGVKVATFKKPTEGELARDYLWRVHRRVPGDGEITIFNRSHYEDVLVVRVHDLVTESVWSRRYDHINDFERLLFDEGTHVVKFFLHISKDEQKERLQARLDNPSKHWKFSLADLDEREHWGDYQQAFEDMLSKTSTAWAPWYIVPADRKWFRDLLVASVLVETLESMEMQYPEREDDLSDVKID